MPKPNGTLIGASIGFLVSAGMFTANALGLIPPLPKNFAIVLMIGTTAAGAATGRWADLQLTERSSPPSSAIWQQTPPNQTVYRGICQSAAAHLQSINPTSDQYGQTLPYVAALLANARIGLVEEAWSPAPQVPLPEDLTTEPIEEAPNEPPLPRSSPDSTSDCRRNPNPPQPVPTSTDPARTWLDELDQPHQESCVPSSNYPGRSDDDDDRSIEFVAR